MRNRRLFFVFFVFLFCVSCFETEIDTLVPKYKNGDKIYSFMEDSNGKNEIIFNDKGELSFLINRTPEFDQMLTFYPESGVLKSIQKKVYNQEETSGRVYHFYNKSGCLMQDLHIFEGNKIGFNVTYHDSTSLIKKVEKYSDLGEFEYKRFFDRTGMEIKN